MKYLLTCLCVVVGSLIATGQGTTTPFNNVLVRTNSRVNKTNFVSEQVVTNGLTLGGVRNTSWPAGSTGANPTASVSGSAVNGVAATFMRSDAAPALANTAVTPGTYGDATHTFTGTVDQQGRLTGASQTTVTGVAPGGAAGGVLSGTYPNPGLSFGSVSSVTNLLVTGKVFANGGVFTNGANVAIDSLINLDLSGGSFLQSVTGGSTLFKSTASAGANGNIVIWPSGDLYSRANLYPNTASTYSLGSASLPWTTIFGQTLTLTNATAGTSEITINGPSSPTAAKIVFNSGGTLQGGLFVPSANTYELRNGTSGQILLLYNTYTDASNYERGKIQWSANVLFIGAENAGSGVARDVKLTSAANLVLRTASADRWSVTSSGHLICPAADNTYDIGAAAATRPRSVFVGPSGGFGSSATNTTVVVSATGATNTLSVNNILYVTAATGASLTDNAGTTEFSGVTIANFTPVRLQPGGKFIGTAITYATGTSSHAW